MSRFGRTSDECELVPAEVSLASKPTGLPARARAKATKEALRREDFGAALAFLQAMIAAGLYVPGHLLAAYIQHACRSRSMKACALNKRNK